MVEEANVQIVVSEHQEIGGTLKGDEWILDYM